MPGWDAVLRRSRSRCVVSPLETADRSSTNGRTLFGSGGQPQCVTGAGPRRDGVSQRETDSWRCWAVSTENLYISHAT